MTDNTQPKAREFNMSQYASKDDMIGAMRKRIAELEAELEAVGAGGVSGPLMGIAAPPTAQAEGWRLVPVEPTTDQEWAGKRAVLRGLTMAATRKIYKAMLAAAPLPPTSAEGVEHG